MQACSSVQLSLNDSSNSITASGSASNSGITCTETLNGTENNNVITVSSLTMTLSNGISCIYTGTLNESGSTFSGTLISNNNTSTYNNYASSYCTSITVTGTKTN